MTLTQITEKGIKDGEILNADINASAAITGTKISPDFGSQNIVTTGSVGIGIGSQTPSTPQKQLHIAHDSSPRIMLSNDTTGHATPNGTELLLDSGGNFEILQRENLNIEFFTNNSQKMTIDGSGNVGIGTTSPDQEFHVKGAGTVATFEGTGGSGFIAIKDSDDGTVAFVGTDAGKLKFQTSGSSYSDKLVIDTSGNVGIGTSSPSSLLNVNTPASGTTTAIEISRTTHGTVGKFINSTGALEIQSNKQLILSSDPAQGMTAAGSMIQFLVDASEKMRVDSNGNVGIGTTSPECKLHLSGTAGLPSRMRITDTTNNHTLGIGADGNGSFQSTINDENHLIYTNGTRRGTWTASGLCFNSDSAAANALDDYEEGTWTPAFQYWNGSAWASVAFSNTPLTTNAGIYTKIGNIVHVMYYSENFQITTGATGAAGIAGLPYQNSSIWTAFPVSHADCFGNDVENGAVNASEYRLRFFTEDGTSNGTWSSSLGHIMLSATYRVA